MNGNQGGQQGGGNGAVIAVLVIAVIAIAAFVAYRQGFLIGEKQDGDKIEINLPGSSPDAN